MNEQLTPNTNPPMAETQHSNILAVILITVIILILAGGGILYWSQTKAIQNSESAYEDRIDELEKQLKDSQDQINELQETLESIDKEEAESAKSSNSEDDTLVYADTGLGIAFSYPSYWGDIERQNDGDNHIALSAFEPKIIFLSADNGGGGLGRGGYWGDFASKIESQEYLNNICSEGTISQATDHETHKCVIKTNTHGLKYAKVSEDIFEMGEPEPLRVLNYYIYNPESDFKGILISDQRLSKKVDFNLENELDALVESLSLLRK